MKLILLKKNVKVVYYDKILWKRENTYESDSISENFFHTVESFVNKLKDSLNIDKSMVYNCIKFLILSSKHLNAIKLDDKIYEDINQIINLFNKINNLKAMASTNDVTQDDISMAKNIIKVSSINILKIFNNDFFVEVVEDLKNLVNNTITLYENKKI